MPPLLPPKLLARTRAYPRCTQRGKTTESVAPFLSTTSLTNPRSDSCTPQCDQRRPRPRVLRTLLPRDETTLNAPVRTVRVAARVCLSRHQSQVRAQSASRTLCRRELETSTRAP